MRYWGMVLVGVLGVVILMSLTVWQIKRMAWKNIILADIENKISAPAKLIPLNPSEEFHSLMPVKAAGHYFGETIKVLVSQKIFGAGYRLITAFRLHDGRKIMVDRGFVSVRRTMPPTPDLIGQVVGNLHWPDEIDNFTPENDLKENIWFARDVSKMAAHLETETVLLVLKSSDFDQERAKPLPVNTASIPNNHQQYAVTWFLLSLIWLGMSGYFVYRSHKIKT